ncbi:MAG: ATP-binding protein, partial [Cyclobacteriaceae bacterium]
LSPSTLKSMGLTFAMADEIKRLNEVHSTRFKYYENVGARRFDELLELNLYRVFQESLTNILKHAQANEVMIQLLFSDNNLSLSIEDDGVGFDTSEVLSNGIGLYNMKRRIQAFNGRIDIESSLQYGTTVMLDINL